MVAPEVHPQEFESAEFKRQIALAWLRQERRRQLSYRIGYLFGRFALHFRNLRRLGAALFRC